MDYWAEVKNAPPFSHVPKGFHWSSERRDSPQLLSPSSAAFHIQGRFLRRYISTVWKKQPTSHPTNSTSAVSSNGLYISPTQQSQQEWAGFLNVLTVHKTSRLPKPMAFSTVPHANINSTASPCTQILRHPCIYQYGLKKQNHSKASLLPPFCNRLYRRESVVKRHLFISMVVSWQCLQERILYH